MKKKTTTDPLSGIPQNDAAALYGIEEPLLTWYARNARNLPWRENTEPYRVWLSEIMLQQTRVEAVKGYYARFLEALPDIPALAAADEDTLFRLWEGLGYYSRARNLGKTAREAVRLYGGNLPASYEKLLTLPGIGEYTAGAIASIAFGIPVPAVDGNVLRILSRFLSSEADIMDIRVRRAIRSLLEDVIPREDPGAFNQALMDLGAMVCRPGVPDCGACPLAGECLGFHRDTARHLPVRSPKKQRRVEQRTIVLLYCRGRLLLFRRTRGVLAGLYEPLNLEGHLSEREVAGHIAELGGICGEITPLPDSRHLFTHIEWDMRGYRADCSELPLPDGAVSAQESELSTVYAIPGAFRAWIKKK